MEKIISRVLDELKQGSEKESLPTNERTSSSTRSDDKSVASSPDKKFPLLKPIRQGVPVLVTEEYLRKVVQDNGVVLIQGRYIITPSAQDYIRKKNITIKIGDDVPQNWKQERKNPHIEQSIAIGSDHRGFALKEQLKSLLNIEGFRILDMGTDKPESCDYPDFAIAVAKKVSSGEAKLGIVIDSAGIGSAIAANKITDIRAAVCWDEVSAQQSRLHNDANVLCIGADNLASAKAINVVKKFISTEFESVERYQRRIDKIKKAEER
ncbi:ribose 5-phosphate isomerase B [bacterium]|nr:MAG: ribose 5-phosphate isomerase B [bacterium]